MVDPRTGHVHVANERRTPFPGAEIEVRVGDDAWGFGGDLAADSLAYVGRVDLGNGARSVVATLRHDDLGTVVNSYGAVLLDAVLPDAGLVDTGLLDTGLLNAGRPAGGS
jgi:hypothetical protein